MSHRGISFSETAAADAVLGYIIAFLVLLSTVKLWHLLRLNPKMNMITSKLQHRLQIRHRPGVGLRYMFDSTPSLETSLCHRFGT